MSLNNKLRVFTAVLILLAAPPYPAFVDAKHVRHRAYRHEQLPAPRQYSSDSLRRIAGGDYVDRQGWRYRVGFGWDNTCFHLDYLDSPFACDGGGSKR